MITQDWFIREVLKKDFVPNSAICPQSPKTDWGQNEKMETRMDKGFQESVPNVPNVPTKKESPCVLSDKDENKSQDLEIIRQWMTDGGRPSNDYLFKLIIEKCEKDEEARKRFVQEAQATKARLLSNAEAAKHPIVNEKVVRLVERDYRRYCKDCAFLDHNGHCRQWQKTNPPNPKYRPVPDVLRNCSLFRPKE
mgnify:CR=1 FL=1